MNGRDTILGGDATKFRFQKAYKNGSLEYLTNGTINGQKVICTARSAAGGCEDLSIALRPGDNELEILASLERVLLGRFITSLTILKISPKYTSRWIWRSLSARHPLSRH
ncbi:MAG: hypothetical protein EBE86_006565 [Hormoscilla sp. GUM202]|nr:hypothetical protein [Hormoscilla sp. GUM202]